MKVFPKLSYSMEILAGSDDYCTLGSLKNLFRTVISDSTISNACLNQSPCGNGGHHGAALMFELMLNYDGLITDFPLWLHSSAQGQAKRFSPVPVTCGQLEDNLKSLGGYVVAHMKARYNWRWDEIVAASGTIIPTPANQIASATWLQCDCCEAARVSTTAQGPGTPGHFNQTHHPQNITHTPKRCYTLPCVNKGDKHANGVDHWIVRKKAGWCCDRQKYCMF
jgi:hypothetical protein